MHFLGRGARFVCWANAWLSGQTSLDEADQKVRGTDAAHHVLGLSSRPDERAFVDPQPILFAFGLLRGAGTTRCHLALPVPGNPVGLAGPPTFNEAALEVGEAVVCAGSGLGLVPLVVGAGVQWQVYDAAEPPVLSLADADAELATALLAATEQLVALDVARTSPEVADALTGIRRVGGSGDESLAPGYSARAERVAARARRCLAVCELALVDDGGSVSAFEMTARRDALRSLEYAARRGLVAACTDLP